MPKSYEKEFIEMLNSNCKSYEITLNGKPVIFYTNNKSIIDDYVNLQSICSEEGLRGKTQPKVVVQYVLRTYGETFVMIAFIWSWGGPWAFVYNCNDTNCSESGSIQLSTVQSGCKVILDENYFTK